MTGAELVVAVEAAGGRVEISPDHQHFKCRVPCGREFLLGEVRAQRQEILEVLRHRLTISCVRPDASGAAVNDPVVEADLSDLAERVNLWARSQCLAVPGCSTSPRRLHDEFSRWARVERRPLVENAFLQRLLELGFVLDECGFIVGVVPKADFMVACEYAHQRQKAPINSLPAKSLPDLKQRRSHK